MYNSFSKHDITKRSQPHDILFFKPVCQTHNKELKSKLVPCHSLHNINNLKDLLSKPLVSYKREVDKKNYMLPTSYIDLISNQYFIKE